MVIKQFKFKGKLTEELKNMSIKDFAQLTPSHERRSLMRGFTPIQKKLLEKIRKSLKKGIRKPVKTHCRDCIIIPEMIGATIAVHNGKEFVPVIITEEMIGHRLGELTMTRKKVQHSAPGIGATKSSSAISVK